MRKAIAVLVLVTAVAATVAGCAAPEPTKISAGNTGPSAQDRTARATKLYNAEAKRLGCTPDSDSWSEEVNGAVSVFTTDCNYRGALVTMKLYSTAAQLSKANPKSIDGKVWGSTHYTDGPIVLSTPGYIAAVAKQL